MGRYALKVLRSTGVHGTDSRMESGVVTRYGSGEGRVLQTRGWDSMRNRCRQCFRNEIERAFENVPGGLFSGNGIDELVKMRGMGTVRDT